MARIPFIAQKTTNPSRGSLPYPLQMKLNDGKQGMVSIVLPTYGRPDYLKEAIKSVANQTYGEIELIIVDDNSPQRIGKRVERMSFGDLSTVKFIRHNENKGANAARSTGIRASKGEFIGFLDDDDYLHPEYISKVVRKFQENGRNVGVITVGAKMVNGEGERIGFEKPNFSGNVTEDILTGRIDPGSFSRFVSRRNIVKKAGLPDERLPSWQDREWHIRLSQFCEYESLPEIHVARRISTHDQISNDYTSKKEISYMILIGKHQDLASKFGEKCERRFRANLTRTLGFSAMRNGYYVMAIKHLFTAIRHDPTFLDTYPLLFISLGGPISYKIATAIKRKLR